MFKSFLVKCIEGADPVDNGPIEGHFYTVTEEKDDSEHYYGLAEVYGWWYASRFEKVSNNV